MDKNYYYNIEQEIKKNRCFGPNNFIDDIVMIIVSILIVPTIFIIIKYPKIGWPIIGVILFCFTLYIYISPSVDVFKYFKKENNRKIIQNILLEKAETEKKAKKILNELNFSKPLRWDYIFESSKIKYLDGLILQTYPSILKIIKKHGINSNDLLKEAIEHYRFKVSTTKEFNFALFPILSFVLALISTFFKDNFTATIMTILVIFIIISIYLVIMRYRKIFHLQYSKKAFYKKMEQALSEIYITNKLNEHKIQFGFKSHLL